jgi:hypothetical protein
VLPQSLHLCICCVRVLLSDVSIDEANSCKRRVSCFSIKGAAYEPAEMTDAKGPPGSQKRWPIRGGSFSSPARWPTYPDCIVRKLVEAMVIFRQLSELPATMWDSLPTTKSLSDGRNRQML